MGPLSGLKVIELVGLGPGPFCGMLLADMGAEVISIERPGISERDDIVCMRGRRSIALDLKQAEAVEVVLDLCRDASVLFEGFRPGVTEKLGIGPQHCMAVNPALIYGRMTGWGQDGPLSNSAGHDINYISLSGALHAIGREGDKPVPPLNLVGDYGGGGMMLAFGIMSALFESQRSGQGQVVDASMVEGSACLMSVFYGMLGRGQTTDKRGTNLLDTGAPFYEVYETKVEGGAESQYISVGPLEPQFYEILVANIDVDQQKLYPQLDRLKWPRRKQLLGDVFATKTRDQWCQVFDGTDACVAPVLSMNEAVEHPHNIARASFVEIDGVKQPAPTPKFSRTKPNTPKAAQDVSADAEPILVELGYSQEKISTLKSSGAVILK